MSVQCKNGIAGHNVRRNRKEVEYWSITDLKEPRIKARVHSEDQIERISCSIQQFGFMGAVIIATDGKIIVGSGRVEAARRLGFDELPVIIESHLSPAQIKAYRIADNKMAELSSWDYEALKLEFECILETDTDFDLGVIGFDTPEIDIILDGSSSDNGNPKDDVVPDKVGSPVTKLGDLWLLGNHKLLCGDARAEESFITLLGDEQVRMVVSDPPFNVRINGHVGGSGKIKHAEFAMASGEMFGVEFEKFLTASLEQQMNATCEGGLLYIFMDWRSLDVLIRVGKELGLSFQNLLVWKKSNAGMGSLYRSQHELICLFKKGTAPHVNNIMLGAKGRYRTNVLQYAGINSSGANRMEDLSAHPTVKPAVMIADIIKDVSKRGDLVLDSFLGSGTTPIAAQTTGRKARCIELDPIYVDTAIRRFEARFGIEAIHAGSGKTFTQTYNEAECLASEPDAVTSPPEQPAIAPIVNVRRRIRPTSWAPASL